MSYVKSKDHLALQSEIFVIKDCFILLKESVVPDILIQCQFVAGIELVIALQGRVEIRCMANTLLTMLNTQTCCCCCYLG